MIASRSQASAKIVKELHFKIIGSVTHELQDKLKAVSALKFTVPKPLNYHRNGYLLFKYISYTLIDLSSNFV